MFLAFLIFCLGGAVAGLIVGLRRSGGRKSLSVAEWEELQARRRSRSAPVVFDEHPEDFT